MNVQAQRKEERHHVYIRLQVWLDRNARFRRIKCNRLCAACPPGFRDRKTDTHHMIYRCGVCEAPYFYWTPLARHWARTFCGDDPRRYGGERDSDLRSLCRFHHGFFEWILRLVVDRRIKRRRPLPNRKAWTLGYVWTWRIAYLVIPVLIVSFALARLG